MLRPIIVAVVALSLSTVPVVSSTGTSGFVDGGSAATVTVGVLSVPDVDTVDEQSGGGPSAETDEQVTSSDSEQSRSDSEQSGDSPGCYPGGGDDPGGVVNDGDVVEADANDNTVVDGSDTLWIGAGANGGRPTVSPPFRRSGTWSFHIRVVRTDGMESWTREHVPALTGLLSVVSLALVFGAALRVLPTGGLPAPAGLLAAIPHVNAVISTAAIGTIAAGVVAARRGEYERHRALMLASLGLFVAFLVLYLYKVSIQGPAGFPAEGPAVVEQFVYYPVLAIHILLAVVCVPLLYYVLLLALTRPLREVFDTPHRRVARVAASLWLVSFLLGNVVYALLYVVY